MLTFFRLKLTILQGDLDLLERIRALEMIMWLNISEYFFLIYLKCVWLSKANYYIVAFVIYTIWNIYDNHKITGEWDKHLYMVTRFPYFRWSGAILTVNGLWKVVHPDKGLVYTRVWICEDTLISTPKLYGFHWI